MIKHESSRGKRVSRDRRLRGMGKARGRRFWATRWTGTLPALPNAGRLMTLVWLRARLSSEERRAIGSKLLEQGCSETCAAGIGAAEFIKVYTEQCEDGRFNFDSHGVEESDEEGLSAIVERHLLPDGLADTCLLLVVGDSSSFSEAVGVFGRVTGVLREGLAWDVESKPSPATHRAVIFKMAKQD